jgi:hypothetical protein
MRLKNFLFLVTLKEFPPPIGIILLGRKEYSIILYNLLDRRGGYKLLNGERRGRDTQSSPAASCGENHLIYSCCLVG